MFDLSYPTWTEPPTDGEIVCSVFPYTRNPTSLVSRCVNVLLWIGAILNLWSLSVVTLCLRVRTTDMPF